MQRWVFRWSLLLLPILIALLFVSGAGSEAGRIERQIWESGHFALFAAASFLGMHWSRLKQLSAIKQLTLILLAGLLLGFITELLQKWVGRSFEYLDIVNDLLGALAGWCLWKSFASRGWRQVMLITTVTVCTLIGIRGLMLALADEYRLNRDFPELADFEHLSELQRWQMRSAWLKLSKAHRSNGRYALKVVFYPGKSPAITLKDLSSDWRGYRFLRLYIFNPGQQVNHFVLKVYDQRHQKNHYRYADRFNQILMLRPGVNDIRIKLSDIENAPDKRKMDMAHIRGLSLSATNLKETTILYLDHIRLE